MGSGTARLVVGDSLVRQLIGEVAPLVERITGWPLAIEAMGSRALPKSRGYEEIVVGRPAGHRGHDARRRRSGTPAPHPRRDPAHHEPL